MTVREFLKQSLPEINVGEVSTIAYENRSFVVSQIVVQIGANATGIITSPTDNTQKFLLQDRHNTSLGEIKGEEHPELATYFQALSRLMNEEQRIDLDTLLT